MCVAHIVGLVSSPIEAGQIFQSVAPCLAPQVQLVPRKIPTASVNISAQQVT